MYLVDIHNAGDDRYLIVTDTLAPAGNRIEKGSDDRCPQHLQNVLEMEIPLGGLAEEIAQ